MWMRPTVLFARTKRLRVSNHFISGVTGGAGLRLQRSSEVRVTAVEHVRQAIKEGMGVLLEYIRPPSLVLKGHVGVVPQLSANNHTAVGGLYASQLVQIIPQRIAQIIRRHAWVVEVDKLEMTVLGHHIVERSPKELFSGVDGEVVTGLGTHNLAF